MILIPMMRMGMIIMIQLKMTMLVMLLTLIGIRMGFISELCVEQLSMCWDEAKRTLE